VIRIQARYRPYSHMPGAKCLLPGTHCLVEAYPEFVLVGSEKIPFHGMGKNFTLQQDLERNCVWVFSSKDRLKISAKEGQIAVTRRGEVRYFPLHSPFYLPDTCERLSFGKSKAQDWDLVWRRFDLKEILPILFALGQKVPGEGAVIGDLEPFCKAAFHHLLVPRLVDDQHQGLPPVEGKDPFSLLSGAYRHIRDLFFKEEGYLFHFSPSMDAGRMVGLNTFIGQLDFEWRKNRVRRVRLFPSRSGGIFIRAPEIQTIRVDGRVQSVNLPVCIAASRAVYIDRFQISE